MWSPTGLPQEHHGTDEAGEAGVQRRLALRQQHEAGVDEDRGVEYRGLRGELRTGGCNFRDVHESLSFDQASRIFMKMDRKSIDGS